MLLTPSPCHKLSHFLGPPSPSSLTNFMDGPFYGVLGRFIQGHFVYGLKIPPHK